MQTKLYRKLGLTLLLSAIGLTTTIAQKGFFQPQKNRLRMDQSLSKQVEKIATYQLRTEDLRSYLSKAVLENNKSLGTGLALEVPLPSGEMETFQIFESPILSPELAERYPEIKTYSGKGTHYTQAVIRLSLTSKGFNAIILNAGVDNVYFQKLTEDKSETYYSYFTKDVPVDSKKMAVHCGVKSAPVDTYPTEGRNLRANIIDTDIRNFRLAFAANGEFTQKNGGTKALAYAALVEYANRMTAVFRNELNVTFTLVSDHRVVFTDPLTDPYTNEDDEKMLDENQAVLDDINYLGATHYDIGHVFGEEPEGSSSGGIASTPAVCDPDSKGMGVTKEGDNTYWTQLFTDQVLFHETGHQFSMSHSYNSNYGPCSTRNRATSVEPGSGASLMSYGFICDSEDYFPTMTGGLFMNFHAVNLIQAKNFLQTTTCHTRVANSNTDFPEIAPMTTSFVIPKSTPFSLTANATDNDDVTYSWEGTNIGLETAPDLTVLENTAIPPFFRSYPPTNSGTRFFPPLASILDGTNHAKGDKLPSVGVVTTHKLTVRDNHPLGGLFSMADVTVTIDGNSGPFVVTNDLAGSYKALSTQTITWAVNNTNLPPINCTLVDIFLSTDGGQTFPTLLTTAPNIGTAVVILPIGETETARIKIAPSTSGALPALNGRALINTPNIFFDISNSNFTITGPLPVSLVEFSAKAEGKNAVNLSWTTASEKNNAGFEIEMSADARTFLKVGQVDGKGDSNGIAHYSHIITELSGGIYYFRLKQIDHDGQFEYSTIRALELRNPDQTLSLYPNPTKGQLKVLTGKYKGQSMGILIFDQNGQMVKSLPFSPDYANGVPVDISSLPVGIYNVVVQGLNFVEKLKFVKL
ncbi:reprolysin-like metallopeptidase [Dyadobacter tibetensis]|uniref:reprolysin-like metallopeptidase n=1 Tax=Dyadobacter tibetensis TaxID=1211851 RepID=UPI00046E90A4|nr:zinc-dependent metalloprotease family protein [Dyadobacter tibetensis]